MMTSDIFGAPPAGDSWPTESAAQTSEPEVEAAPVEPWAAPATVETTPEIEPAVVTTVATTEAVATTEHETYGEVVLAVTSRSVGDTHPDVALFHNGSSIIPGVIGLGGFDVYFGPNGTADNLAVSLLDSLRLALKKHATT